MTNLKKLIIVTLFCLISSMMFGQEEYNVGILKVDLLNSKDKVVKKKFIMDYRSYGKIIESPIKIAKTTGVDSKYFTSCMVFWTGDENTIDFSVNSKSFNMKYFRKKIGPFSDQKQVVVISTKVYMSDSEPLVIIEKIRLKK